MRVHLVGTYPPMRCGIAEYTYELARALASRGLTVGVIAIDEGFVDYMAYPEEVELILRRDDLSSYQLAAEYVNRTGSDLVCVQHEYGIFGGRWGWYILEFMEAVDCPLVTTLHTVLPNPDKHLKKVTEALVELSDAVTVMSHSAYKVLSEYYDVDLHKIRVIPHGVVGSLPNLSRKRLRKELGVTDNFVLLTIGLLGPNKGVEYAIMAMPRIVEHIHNALYLVVGETHPKIRALYGEKYRVMLMRLTRELGLEDHVRFINHFLTKEDYIRYIVASDVVLLPYLDRNQVSSGALSYAFSYGRVIVSTPFLYAEELLSEGRGILCRFKDPDSIADSVIKVAKDPYLRASIEANVARHSAYLRWDVVVSRLISLFTGLIAREHGCEKSELRIADITLLEELPRRTLRKTMV